MPDGYAIAWEAGAGAQIELFSPELDSAAVDRDYRLKFSPPMRKTIRPPMTGLQLGHGELGPIIGSLNKLGAALDVRRPAAGLVAGAAVAETSLLEQAREAGGLLYTLIIPNDVQIELADDDLFVEIGVDEALLEYPWELLHDGSEFLCLRHPVGRFVNVTRAAIPGSKRPTPIGVGPLSVLLISVPAPQPRKNGAEVYDPLPGVEEETEAIATVITDLGPLSDLEILKGKDATWSAVAKALKQKRYHIVHYCGHAFFDSSNPINSSLALHDLNMTAGHIRGLCRNAPPVLFFINGCESTVGRGAGDEWKNRYDIFGLARAFLETGAYLLGNRWRVNDKGAANFAKAFYKDALAEQPIGRAVREARKACKDLAPDDFAWASYVYYGDPRIRFRKVG
jgi:CHAT domain-containing protein